MTNRIGSYRIQLRPGFGFSEASRLTQYWQRLGVSHDYCSPYLQASTGSTHGYDVVDHHAVNRELGGSAARALFCEQLAEHRLKQLIDVVPNHMAIRGGHNAWWWDVLENGPSSRYSSYFDVEWRASDSERVLLPVLGDQYGVELEAGNITIERRGPHLLVCYYEHRNPVAPRSLGQFLRPVAESLRDAELEFVADALCELPAPNAPDLASRRRRHRDKQILATQLERLLKRQEVADAVDLHAARINASADALHELLEAQNFRLAYWRAGNHELDYRRFFDIDSLVGLRVEDDEVFESTHKLILEWLADGSVDGLRIDHIDGLYDPQGYLDRLRRFAPSCWLLVEKIIEGPEELPAWPVAGTTGYEFLNQTQRFLVDPQGEDALTELSARLLGEHQDYERIVHESKLLVLREALGSDVKRLVNRLVEICQVHRRYRDYSRAELEEVVTELCAAFPVYRTYVRHDGTMSNQDATMIRTTCEKLAASHPHIDTRLIEFMQRLLLLEWRDEAEIEFVMRFQQLTSPVMAKGVEDTTFYRYVWLVALNEVGGDPSHFSLGIDEYHAWMAHRQASHPEALNATSTHDTKRSEDVRARLLTLSEVPGHWEKAVRLFQSRVDSILGSSLKTPLPVDSQLNYGSARPLPVSPRRLDPLTEYLLWQNLVGAWPIDKERITEYMRKAVREAKLYTSWQSASEAYDNLVDEYIAAIYQSPDLPNEIGAFVDSIEGGMMANSLNQLLLKLMGPGVPDIYQGTELFDLSLVDPDNRRKVDYSLRQQLLDSLDDSSPAEIWDARASGLVKLHFLRKGLSLRSDRSHSFGPMGGYARLDARGTHASRVFSFMRGTDVIAVVSRLWTKFGSDFGETTLTLPEGSWVNVLTGMDLLGTMSIQDILGPFPGAMLERTQTPSQEESDS